MTPKSRLERVRGLVRDLPLIVSLCAMGLLVVGLLPVLRPSLEAAGELAALGGLAGLMPGLGQ